MENYTPNSHRFKEMQKNKAEKKKVEKVVTGKVITKKKSELSKVRDVFLSEDIHNVKTYILMDVLVPTIKKAISDIVRDGVDMLLYGESGKKKSSSNSSYVSYRDYSRNDERRYSSSTRTTSRYNLDEIVLGTRGEAEQVIQSMDDLIDNYGIVSVADLFDLVGVTSEYTDNRYGWTSVRSAEPVRVKDGYIIRLPKPIPID